MREPGSASRILAVVSIAVGDTLGAVAVAVGVGVGVGVGVCRDVDAIVVSS